MKSVVVARPHIVLGPMRMAVNTALAWLVALASSGLDAKATPAQRQGSKGVHDEGAMLRSCLYAIGAQRLPVFPESWPLYDAARRTFNGGAVRKPAAVFYAFNTRQVSQAVQCARRYGFKVTPASGRQGFTGDSVRDGYLVVDVSGMNQITHHRDKRTLTVGPGVSGGVLQSFLYDNGLRHAEVPSGYCTWVGVGGFALGGGFGPSGRYLGLACDSVVAVETVLYNGTVVRADKDHHADMLWASCGGGGGTFGVATAFELKIHTLPNNGRVTIVELRYSMTKAAATRAIMRLQDWLPSMDNRYGIDGWVIGSGLTGPWLYLKGVYFGPVHEALQGLEDASMLQDLDAAFPQTHETSDVASEYPYGVRLQGNRTMYDFYFETAPSWSAGIYNLPTPWALNGQGITDPGYSGTPHERAYLEDLMRARGPNGQVVGGPLYNGGSFYSQSRMTGRLEQRTIEAMMDTFAAARAACPVRGPTNPLTFLANFSSACSYIGVGHVLGGAYWAKRPNETAFVHRDKYFVIAAQTLIPSVALPFLPQAELEKGYDRVDELLRILEPSSSDTRAAAYVNYMNPPGPLFREWRHAFWGDNYPRLQRIKATYDPEGVFTKPLTVGAGSNGRTRRHTQQRLRSH